MEESVIKVKSYQFSLRVIKLYKHLTEDKRNTFFQNKYYEAEHLLAQMWRKQVERNRKKIL
jgi:hypothetical protein